MKGTTQIVVCLQPTVVTAILMSDYYVWDADCKINRSLHNKV